MRKVRQDDPPGVKAREEAAQGQTVEGNVPSHTDASGRFVSGNQNPFPVPADFRGGPSAVDPKNSRK